MKTDAFELRGRVVAALTTRNSNSHLTQSVDKIEVKIGHGIIGDRHAGNRFVDAREEEMIKFGFLKKQTQIQNCREFSAISIEELLKIGNAMGLPPIPYGYLGENLVIAGIDRFTELPSGSLLFFQGDKLRDAVLRVSEKNEPCEIPGKAIREYYRQFSPAVRFKDAANGKRGIVGTVFASGFIHQGDEVIVKVPKQ